MASGGRSSGEGPARLKRRREEEDDGYGHRQRTADTILSTAIKICDKQEINEAQTQASEQLDNLHRAIVRDFHNSSTQLIRILLDCAVELPHKTTVYAALIGLLNTEENEFIGQLLKTVQEEFEEALKGGNRNKARLLLRLFAALVPSNTLHAFSVLKALQYIVETAIEIADKGGDQRDEQRIWQPYTDYLVYITLMALPWGGLDLAESVPAELENLFEEIGKYMELRPAASTPALRPFFEGDDTASTSDSGAASFLGQVWEATQEMRSTGKWTVTSIPSYVTELNEAQLATGKPHDLTAFSIPKTPPCLPADHRLPAIEAATAVLASYPPRGVIRLLPPENTWGDKPKIERLVAEEYIIDTIHYYDGDRVECARTLALGLPLEGKLEPILAEVVFSQMMRVPTPHFKPIAYATILADICRLLPAVPRSMSACMREFFQRMHALDPQLRSLLAEWLSYHLSNFDFMWPWAKWAYILEAPPHNAQRRFVIDTISRLIRLSYYSNIVSKVPDNFSSIFPPKPEPLSLEEKAPPADANGHSDDQKVSNGTQSKASASERKWAAEFIQLVKQRKSTDEALQWIAENGVEEELGGKLGVLKMVLRGLMVAGAKSFTHMVIALERFDNLLLALLADTGERGQVALVSSAADVWKNAPQRAAQAIDRLMGHRLVEGAAIIRWAFSSQGLLHLTDQLANGLAWEAVYNAVNKTLARTQDAKEELDAAQIAAGIDPSNAADTEMEDAAAAEAAGTLEIVDDRDVQRKADYKEKKAEYEAAVQTQNDLLVLCFESFRDVLEAHKPGDQVLEPVEAEAAREWYSFTLACLRAFTRRYHAVAAPLSETLETGIFADASTDPAVKRAFMISLHI